MKKKIYLDYAAATPIDPLVLKAMLPYFEEKHGNPSSLHKFGQEAMEAVDLARETIAKALGVSSIGGFKEIIFTSGATEANNLVLRGVIKSLQVFDSSRIGGGRKYLIKNPRIIISAIEHKSIFETAKDLRREGVEVVFIPVNRNGIIDLKKIKESLNNQTVLISVMYANNEIGVIEPVKKISEIVLEFKKNKEQIYPLFHTDAVQAFQFLDCNVDKLGVDFLTLSAHKIYGPKGIGLLWAKNLKHSFLVPIITGGGQEFGFRAGTENVPLIVGFSKAVSLVVDKKRREAVRMKKLHDFFCRGIKKISGKIEILNRYKALPNIISVYFPSFSAQDMLIKLDQHGISVSSGSACSSRSLEKSYVFSALGFEEKKILGSVRFSFGRFTTLNDLKETIRRLRKILAD
ncbi:MAG: cysteine desulfurase family protein [Patescibacteria group bacterium]|nr:cysteine desulfurase family protein [Patescibacteria group bacterium]